MSEPTGLPEEDRLHPPATVHRRRPSREGISGAAFTQPIAQDLIRAYAKNVLRAWPYELLLIFAILSSAPIWQPFAKLLPGAIIIVATAVGAPIACRWRLRQPEPRLSPRIWRFGLLVTDLATGVGWLVMLWPFLNLSTGEPLPPAAHTFVLLVSISVVGATAILRAPLAPSAYIGAMPLVLVVLIAALNGNGREGTTFALLALGFQLFMLSFAHRLHRVTVATFRSRAELRAKLAELEQVKANTIHARQRAEEAERAKAQFLATVSHELRTPLNAIIGFSEVMKNEVLGSHSTPSYREYSSDIHGSGQHLLTLIDEMLELSRIESGRYELNEEPARLRDIVNGAMQLMADQAAAKGLSVKLTVDPALDLLRVDVRAVRQVILNLLSNAIKFTPPGGHVTVKAGWTSLGGQYVSIADDGPGIPKEEIPIALSSFGRGTLAASTAAQGVGLGLPIAKGLMDLHGGRFILRSTPRAGTEAIVIFPASRRQNARGPTNPGSGAAAA